MQITVELPDDLTTLADPAREALEALVIAGYRSGALSFHQIRVMLGFATGDQLDGFLKSHEVWDHAYDLEDLEEDRAVFMQKA